MHNHRNKQSTARADNENKNLQVILYNFLTLIPIRKTNIIFMFSSYEGFFH